jgi:hypothetical protein
VTISGNINNAEIQILNLSNQIVMSKNFPGGSIVIPLNNLSSGFYILRVSSKKALKNFKLIIQR